MSVPEDSVYEGIQTNVSENKWYEECSCIQNPEGKRVLLWPVDYARKRAEKTTPMNEMLEMTIVEAPLVFAGWPAESVLEGAVVPLRDVPAPVPPVVVGAAVRLVTPLAMTVCRAAKSWLLSNVTQFELAGTRASYGRVSIGPAG